MCGGAVDPGADLGRAAAEVAADMQAEAAMALGLRCGQGFYFGKPVDPEEALAAFE